jgi:hypothetical protein
MAGTDQSSTDELQSLRIENAQQREALESRIAIEQAKGILAERLQISIDEAFGLLRYSARSAQMPLHQLARDVQPGRVTPLPVVVGLSRSQRWRAAGQRERAEAQRETAHRELVRLEELAARWRREPPSPG